MALPRRAGRSRVTLALLILTSIAVLTLDFRDSGIVESLRRTVATIFSPLSGVVDTATRPFRNGWHGVTRYEDVQDENDRLRHRIEELEGQAVFGAGAVQELADLSAELDIPWIGEVPRATARVVTGPTSNFAHSVELDKGSKAGVKVGMPVVNGSGLVGRVQQVTSSHSIVQLITDPEFRVGVKVLEGGVLGTARGRGPGSPLVMDTGLDADDPLEPGGSVATSGANNSRYPASIPVGTVRGTEKAGGGLTLDLLVEPYVDTRRLTFVTVLLWEARA